MKEIVKATLNLNNEMNKEDKFWTYKSHNYSEKIIKRNIENYFKFLEFGKISKRQRAIFSIPLMDIPNNSLVGYSIINIFSDAKPLKYETQFKDKLTCVYLKDFIIKPNYWEIKYPSEKKSNKKFYYPDKLINMGTDIADKLNKEFICDILYNDERMKNILERNGIFEDFQWKTEKNKNLMIRMVR